jgi:hypothetical protein
MFIEEEVGVGKSDPNEEGPVGVLVRTPPRPSSTRWAILDLNQ